jgi:hypothetical protein
MIGDNFNFDMTARDDDGETLMVAALQLAMVKFPQAVFYRARAHLIKDRKAAAPSRLTLFWTGAGDVSLIPFPTALSAVAVEPIIRAWLKSAEISAYGPRMNHDGDNERGWRIFTRTPEEYDHRVIVNIEPAWIVLGK